MQLDVGGPGNHIDTCGSGSLKQALGPMKGQLLGMDADTTPEGGTAPGWGWRGACRTQKEEVPQTRAGAGLALRQGLLTSCSLAVSLTCLTLVLALGPALLQGLPIPQFNR